MFNEFKNLTLGKAIDVDNAYGPQCMDLFNYFNDLYNNGERISAMPSKYARSLAENKANNGILKNFNETTINNMIEGTVVVYGKCKYASEGHVCFFIKDNGDGTFQALQQNDHDRHFVTIDNNPYEGIIGAFIPKQIQEEFNRKLEEQRKAQEIKPQSNEDKKYLNLSDLATSWRVYPMGVAPVVGNEKAKLAPAKNNGLSYTIKGYTQPTVAIIETKDFGQVQIYIGPDVSNMFSITDSPIYDLIN